MAATDGGTEAAAASAAVEASVAPLAANESAVTRYPDESPVNHMPETTRWSVANVRTQASNSAGDLVTAIKAGTDVEKIADHQSYSLVVFADPTDPSRKDMGWVSQAVFTPEPAHKHIAVHCTGGQVPILLQAGEEICVKECTQDSTCPKGNVCNGSGVLSNNGAPGAATKFCEPRAGAADAGASAAQDGGQMKPLDWKPSNGQCPAGYGHCGESCRLQCSGKDSDCGSGAHCQGGFCVAPGKAPCK
jgi:hypothetical protein